MIELVAHRIDSGFFNDPKVIRYGRLLPGAFIVRVPVCGGTEVKMGIVIGVLPGIVTVAWTPWNTSASYARGELLARMEVRQRGRRRRGR